MLPAHGIHSYFSIMQNARFIFSEQFRFRLARHLVFWLLASFGLGLAGIIIRLLFRVPVTSGSVYERLFQPLLYFPGQVFLVYTLLYWVMPKYFFRSCYRPAVLLAVLLAVAAGFIGAISYDWWFDSLSKFQHGRWFSFQAAGKRIEYFVASEYGPVRQHLPYDFFFALQSVVNIAALAVAVKLMKHWYEKEYRNSVLQKEKLDAELQSLKAQLHPHFLFNTLNNIYSLVETTSPPASAMLLQLSAILRYILYDCDKPVVRLSQEFTLIRDYADLEKVRYNQLELATRFPADADRYGIAPLLLLPLVENCFKHGASQQLDQPWVSIDAVIDDGWLGIKLINSRKPDGQVVEAVEGIGLQNVRRRLALIYPGAHELQVLAEGDHFIVICKLKLQPL
jgi:hypothetical protein